MVNAWSLAHDVLNGTLDENFPIMTGNIEINTGTGNTADTITIPSGATLTNNGTATGFASSTPAFLATRDSNQSISANTTTKIQYDDESFDTDNTYDNSSNYRFTPGVSGKYVIGASAGVDT